MCVYLATSIAPRNPHQYRVTLRDNDRPHQSDRFAVVHQDRLRPRCHHYRYCCRPPRCGYKADLTTAQRATALGAGQESRHAFENLTRHLPLPLPWSVLYPSGLHSLICARRARDCRRGHRVQWRSPTRWEAPRQKQSLQLQHRCPLIHRLARADLIHHTHSWWHMDILQSYHLEQHRHHQAKHQVQDMEHIHQAGHSRDWLRCMGSRHVCAESHHVVV